MKWALIMAAKILLSRLNIPYGVWRKLGVFRLGGMDTDAYALKIFRLHMKRAFGAAELNDKVILEIGPGDSFASAVIGRAYGADQIVLVDAGPVATADIAIYAGLAARLREEGLAAPELREARNLKDLLSRCRARYLTAGVGSLREIGTASVDYIWSHSVLEHIPKRQVGELFAECKRVLRPGGLMSHNIDFQDHLSHSLNCLRFSEAIWESALIRNSGFYTNRIRAREMHGLVRQAGFAVLEEDFGRWPTLPLPKRKLHGEFQKLDNEDFVIRTSHILAQA